jgi:L-ribulose-5-phosphate 4-epimerase
MHRAEEAMNANEAKAEVLRAGHELVEKGLVARTWGNASCRISEELFAITPSGIAYDRITEDDISIVNIATLKYEGKRKPSSEKGIHAASYRISPETNFVIHTHQTCASAMSVTGYTGSALSAEEKALLGGEIGFSSYGLPGTKKLRRNVERILKKKICAILMERHGALLTGSDRQAAFRRAVLLEEICNRSISYSPSSDCEKTIYSKRVPGGFTLTQNRTARFVDGNIPQDESGGNDTAALLHAAIYAAYPEFNYIAHLFSAPVLAAMENNRIMPAMLDDFAQIAGSDAKIERPPNAKLTKVAARNIKNNLNNRNCVCIDGWGAVCCASDESECTAIMNIIEKNALACIHVGKSGQLKPLPFLDRKLMRFNYTHKYAKMKG